MQGKVCYNRENERKGNDYMKVIVCVDDNNGMMFNNRRQSRDRAVLYDIYNILGGKKLFITKYSEKPFAELGMWFLYISDDILEKATSEDYCFIEDKALAPYANKINELIIYRWNRNYPADTYLDIDPTTLSLKLISSDDIGGFSHERITKDVYRK